MKEQTKRNLKTAATVTGLALGATYLVMRHIAKKQYPDSVYANQPEEQNPVQGRKVVFVENANDPVNADGKQGHLEAVGNSTHIPTFYEKYIKRGFDVVLSFGGLVVLAPVYAVTALAIKTDDPGPVFFKQKRVGTDKSYFELLKFRSMSVNTPKDVPTHMLQNGGITKVGAFIRKASIDELPQLWNIFRGNMSVIGPRPALWNQDYLTAERDKYGANDVKPGLTGLAQISGRDELEIEEKAKLDGAYARALKKSSWIGFKMDVRMFLGSISATLHSKGVVEGGTGALKKDHMKILTVCQYYYPEPFRISDICEELVKRGNDVTVLTGVPNYPMGEIYDGYQNGQHRDEKINGVSVHRCFTIGRKGGTLKRFLNYYSYAISSTIRASHMTEDFDVVFVNQLSPVMMAYAGMTYAKKHHKKLVLYCLDLWPDSLCAGGIKKDSFIYKRFHKISAKIYKAADTILITSNSFREYLENELFIDPKKIVYLPQYAEQQFTPEACHKESDNNIDLMFAGNIGTVQSVETIIDAAKETQDVENLRWHIVGDGSDLERCKEMANGLENVVFHGRQPLEEMPKYYSMADAMIVSMQNDPVLSKTLPGKVQTYMAAGKPIIGSINGETQSVIKEANCGVCVAAEDAHALADAVRSIIEENKWQEYGQNAFDYYQKHFSKRSTIDKLVEYL